MSTENLSTVLEEAKQGKRKSFNQFFLIIHRNCLPKLLDLSHSKFEADEVFAEVISKFWLRFVVEDHPIPKDNIEGYVYRMCVNCFYDRQRKKKIEKLDYMGRIPEDTVNIEDKSEEELWQELKSNELRYQAFSSAMRLLTNKCQVLYDRILNEGKKLKDIWEPLGYKSYSAIKDSKYRCKKELTHQFFLEFERLKATQEVHK